MTDDELMELLKALERAKEQATYAYEFVPNSYTYHAYVSCLNAHRMPSWHGSRSHEPHDSKRH